MFNTKSCLKILRAIYLVFVLNLIKNSLNQGLQINSNSNDIVITNAKNISCLSSHRDIHINNNTYCGINCDSHQQTIYNGFICRNDGLILNENGCMNVGVTNDVKDDSIQTVTISKLLDDIYIYYKEKPQEDVKAAYKCSFQRDKCPVFLRSYTKSEWEVTNISSCFIFATNSAQMQFSCNASRATELEGTLLKVDITCQFSKEIEIENETCVIFKVAGTVIDAFNKPPSSCAITPVPVVTTPIPGSIEEFDPSNGWIIMSIIIFVILLVFMVLYKWVYMRETNNNNLGERDRTETEDPNVIEEAGTSFSIGNANNNDIPDSAKSYTNSGFADDEDSSKLSVRPSGPMPSYAKIIKDKIKRPKPPRTFSKKSLITSEIDPSDDSTVMIKNVSPYEEVDKNNPKIVVASDYSTSTISSHNSQKNFYEEIPLTKANIVKPKRKKFSVKRPDTDDDSQSDTYLSPKEAQNQNTHESKEIDVQPSNPEVVWKSQALKRQKFLKENSLLKQLHKKKLMSLTPSETSDESKDDTLSLEKKKKRSIASTNSDDAMTLKFDGKNKPVYTNKDTVIPIETLRQFDEVDAFTGDKNKTTENIVTLDNSKERSDQLPVSLKEDTSESTESEKSDDVTTPPLVPRKHRTVSWYGNNDVIMDKMYMKPPTRPSGRSRSEGSAALYYDIIPTIKGDKKSSIKINFRRPIPREVDLTRLPYSQFNYGRRKRSDENKSTNGFCLLLANYFLESITLDIANLRSQIPKLLNKAEKIWQEGHLHNATVEEAHDILKKVHYATYRVNIGEELFWCIHQGLGGFSAFQALHEIYHKCVNSNVKECLVLTFSPDKSCICLFDEFGNQVFVDVHIHFKTNHQKLNAALQDNECGGVICKAAKHTSDVLLNFIISNMCLEMKADPNTGSAFPLTKRKDYDLI